MNFDERINYFSNRILSCFGQITLQLSRSHSLLFSPLMHYTHLSKHSVFLLWNTKKKNGPKFIMLKVENQDVLGLTVRTHLHG